MPGAIAYPLTGLYGVARAGKGTISNAAGNLEEVANDTARLTFDAATLLPLGLRIEEQRSNLVRNPRAEGGAAGTPGTPPTFWSYSGLVTALGNSGLALENLGPVSLRGMTGLRFRVSGIATATSSGAIVLDTVSLTQNQLATSSIYSRVIAGSVANLAILYLRTRALTAGFVETAKSEAFLPRTDVAAMAQLTRYSATMTVPADGANVTTQATLLYQINWTTGQAYDFTIEIFAPQFEPGDCATSPILPPSGAPAAATRPADAISITDLSKVGWASQGMSMIWTGRIDAAGIVGGINKGLFRFDNGAGDQVVLAWVNPDDNRVRLQITIDNVSYYALAPGSAVTPGVDFTVRATFGPGLGRISLNGGAAGEVSAIPAGMVPFNLSRLKLGVSGGGYNACLNGTVRSFAMIPGTASAAELPALAA